MLIISASWKIKQRVFVYMYQVNLIRLQLYKFQLHSLFVFIESIYLSIQFYVWYNLIILQTSVLGFFKMKFQFSKTSFGDEYEKTCKNYFHHNMRKKLFYQVLYALEVVVVLRLSLLEVDLTTQI